MRSIGDNIGFGIGWFGGYALLRRFGKYIRLDEPKLKVGRYIFIRHGAKVVFFGRFVSILRTYAAFLAGTNRMRWTHFLIANAAGGLVWSVLYGVTAFELASAISKLSAPFEIAFAALAVVGDHRWGDLHPHPRQAAGGRGRGSAPGSA